MMEADRLALCGAKNVPDIAHQTVRGSTARSNAISSKEPGAAALSGATPGAVRGNVPNRHRASGTL